MPNTAPTLAPGTAYIAWLSGRLRTNTATDRIDMARRMVWSMQGQVATRWDLDR